MYPDSQAIHSALFQTLRSALALTETEADHHLIRAYAAQAQPEPSPSQNVCYYYLQTDPHSTELQESSTDSSNASIFSFIPCRLILVFFGPDCESWAHHCRSFLFLDGTSHPRAILRAIGLHLIPNPPPPSILYEDSSKTWRKRADVVIDARLVDNSSYSSAISHEPLPVDTIQKSPEVKIHVNQ